MLKYSNPTIILYIFGIKKGVVWLFNLLNISYKQAMNDELLEKIKEELREKPELGVEILKNIYIDAIDFYELEEEGITDDPHFEETTEENLDEKLGFLCETIAFPFSLALISTYKELEEKDGTKLPMLNAIEEDLEGSMDIIFTDLLDKKIIEFFSSDCRKRLFESGLINERLINESAANASPSPFETFSGYMEEFKKIAEAQDWLNDEEEMKNLFTSYFEEIGGPINSDEFVDFYSLLGDGLVLNPRFLVSTFGLSLGLSEEIYKLLIAEGREYNIDNRLVKEDISYDDYCRMLDEAYQDYIEDEPEDIDKDLFKIVSPFLDFYDGDESVQLFSDLITGLDHIYKLQKADCELKKEEEIEKKLDRAEGLLEKIDGTDPTFEGE